MGQPPDAQAACSQLKLNRNCAIGWPGGEAGPADGILIMKRFLWVGSVLAAVLGAASACAANSPTVVSTNQAVQPRTAVPTWTLPFTLTTPTPQPVLVSATAISTPVPTQPAPTPLLATAVLPTAVPTALPRLIVPELGLDQRIVPVLIHDGTWDMDPLGEDIGWLTTTGEKPGGPLAVTLAGHVNISVGNAGPFVNLKRLDVDDRIVYRYGDVDYEYAVRGQQTVEPDAVEALYVADGKQLLLVTCSNWSYFWGHYARRIIVTAELITTELDS